MKYEEIKLGKHRKTVEMRAREGHTSDRNEYIRKERRVNKLELWIIWLIIAGVLIVVEMLTLTFYLLWLGIGAAAAALVDVLFPGAFLLEVVVGCAVALVLTLFTKPLTRRLHSSREFKDAVDELVGKQGVLLEGIGVNIPGIVKIGNETWSAIADEPIFKGDKVVVISRGSAVLKCRKV